MFELELQEEKRTLKELQLNIQRLIRDYENRLKLLQREFSKTDKVAEKQIDEMILKFEKDNSLEAT